MDFKQMFIENFGQENYELLEKSFEDLSYRGLRINYKNFQLKKSQKKTTN